MKKLMKGGLVAVAAVACASFAFAAGEQSASDNTLVKGLISGEMTQAQPQLVAQTAVPRAQATANPARQQTAQQKQAAAAKAKQAQQQANRQQQTIRQQQLMRQQQILRQQRMQAARQQAAAAQQNVAAVANEGAAAFESFESTFVNPEAVSEVSTAAEQAVQNVEETLSPSAPTASN